MSSHKTLWSLSLAGIVALSAAALPVTGSAHERSGHRDNIVKVDHKHYYRKRHKHRHHHKHRHYKPYKYRYKRPYRRYYYRDSYYPEYFFGYRGYLDDDYGRWGFSIHYYDD